MDLDRDGRLTHVPADADCRIIPEYGPGTPHFVDTAPALVEALRTIDDSLARGEAVEHRREALDTFLPAAQGRDTLALWHLARSLTGAERGVVLTRLNELVPVVPSQEPAVKDDDGMEALYQAAKAQWFTPDSAQPRKP